MQSFECRICVLKCDELESMFLATAKPVLAKRQPPLFSRIRRALTFISLSSHPPVLAHLAKAPHLAACGRPLPRRFVSPPSVHSDCRPHRKAVRGRMVEDSRRHSWHARAVSLVSLWRKDMVNQGSLG